jgi:xanthine dehydrogenase accessory factor
MTAALLDELLLRVDRGERVALCVVVSTRGSTPQKAGSAMLVTETGQTLGTLGGGCVEAEARVRALRLMHARSDGLLDFKLTTDYGWDDGLACGGSMRVAVTTLDADRQAPDTARQELWPPDLRGAREALRAGQSASITLHVPDDAGTVHSFEQVLHPAPTLLIAGAGHIAAALAGVARTIDFDVAVIDDRADHLTEARFPSAQRLVGDIERSLRAFPITAHTHVVIVTRGHQHDAAALGAVVSSPARYVGLIGSKRKVQVILQRLRDEGVSEVHLDRVHTPIGLDIGAVTPGEIALSIAAELVAVRRGVGTDAVKSMRWRA